MDRSYEDNATRELAIKQGFIPVVPPKWNRKEPWDYDKELYKHRNEVERYFLRIKRFTRVFTRYDKLDVLYLGNLTMAMIFDAIFMWTRSNIIFFVSLQKAYTLKYWHIALSILQFLNCRKEKYNKIVLKTHFVPIFIPFVSFQLIFVRFCCIINLTSFILLKTCLQCIMKYTYLSNFWHKRIIWRIF